MALCGTAGSAVACLSRHGAVERGSRPSQASDRGSPAARRFEPVFATARKSPFDLAWDKIPVVWVDGQRFRHGWLFSKSPLKLLSATVGIEPDGNGGELGHYTLNTTAANLFGTAILNTAFFSSVEKNFTALAKGAEEWAAQNRDMPFEMPVAEVTPEVRRRLDEILE